jgi:hypothetical protein
LAITFSPVIIDDLSVVGIPDGFPEAHPPLVVDPDAVLSPSITGQCVEMIARRGPEVAQGARPVEFERTHHLEYIYSGY